MKWTKWADALRCIAIEVGDGEGVRKKGYMGVLGAEEGSGDFGRRRGVHRGLWGMSERS